MSDLGQRIANLSPEQRAQLRSRLLQKGAVADGTTIPRREATSDRCPLSFAQQRLWFLQQLEPGNVSYNITQAVRMSRALDIETLQQALETIVARHAALRTSFAVVEGQPVQVIAPALQVPLPVKDLAGLPRPEREAEALRRAREERRRPFDLGRDPLLRAELLRLGEEEHVLLVSTHHIVSDGWSMDVFWRELAALYDAFSTGRPSPLPELPIQYADFAVWQREWLQGEVLEGQLSYWKQQLGGTLPVLELPTDRPRPPVQTFRGARQSLTLPKPLTEALKELSRREGATLFMVLLAAFQALLHRYTGQDDIVVGSPIANRNRAEVEGLIGFFVNTLALRGDLSGDPSFRELLGRVREAALGAYAHQDVPFEKLVEELKPERDMSHTPLFQTIFVLQNAPRQALESRNLSLSWLKVDTGTAKFDLTLSMSEGPEGLEATFEYNTDLFDATTITRMQGHLWTLLEGIVAEPERPVSELPLLSEAERRQLLVEWNDTQREYPKDACIHELFEEQVECTPEAVAVDFEDEQLTYRELNRRANRLAHTLRELGVGPDTPVGVCLERSPEMIVALLGVLKAGGAYVPLDPTYPEERLSLMLEDARVLVLLTQEATRRVLPAHAVHTLCLDADHARIEQASTENPQSGATGDDLAYVIYTSGSTGLPKGVCVPHRAVSRLVVSTDYVQITDTDVVAQASNAAFDAATWEIWGALLHGARLVILPRDTVLSPHALAASIERHGISALFLTTALFNQIARENPATFRPLRHLLFGGEAVEPKWVREVLAKGAPERLLHVYGPTETTTFATWHLVEEVEDGATTIPIGSPIANTEAYVLDARLRPVPVGVPGELYIGGPGVAHGYLNRPELTDEKFVSHPFSDEPGMRLYRTGDRVRHRANGDIEFVGRTDYQVKIRGFRIEPGEIEATLGQHPEVRQSAVLAREDAPGEKRLVAYVVPYPERTLAIGELRDFLKERLPEHMVPAAFVVLEGLPLTPNGKVDRESLPAPDTARPEFGEGFVAPRTPSEAKLAGIWAEVLGLERVGVHDDFFELGGHSLLAVRLFAQIEKTFDQRLPLATLFQAPTVRQLADTLERGGKGAPWSSLVVIQPYGSQPPFFCVHGGGGHVLIFNALAQHLGPDQPFYGLQALEQDEERIVPWKVEDTAASYVRELRRVQPEGPYFLGGYCSGGVVAFEMAQQLHAQGQDVALLALLDTMRPNYLKASVRAQLHHHVRKLRRRGPLSYVRDKLWKVTKKRIRRIAWNVAYRSSLQFGYPPARVFQGYYHTRQRTRRDFSSYKAQPYLGRITLFRATRSKAYWKYPDEPSLGWDSVAAGGVEVHEVRGTHPTLLKEPHVRVVAERLKTCLEQARESLS